MFQDLNATPYIWETHFNLAIKSPRSCERLVKQLRIVGRGEDDNTTCLGESIKLSQELIQRLLHIRGISFVPLCPNGIKFIDKYDSRSLAASLVEQIPNTLGAHADIYLVEFRPRHVKERNARLSCYSTSK